MSIYERELREILAGNEEVIKKITKNFGDKEKEKYMKIIENPFITVRAAGSLGIADIVAIRGDLSFIVEIKVRKEKDILFSHEGGRMQRKAEEMHSKCLKSKILPVFAFRIKGVKGESWRIFTMEIDGIEGKSKELYDAIPKLEKSRGGNYIMRWDNGMKLSDFIELVSC
ncbi:MAG TPA: Holliday junction resolvase [Thermoplasmatales archaeon]|nr:Holliday junction resolvase [Thermoplasmatales archaeon]